MGVERGNVKKDGEPLREEAVVPAESVPTSSRKPYQKPAFRFERVFETMALACGKISGTQRSCHQNRKTS